MKKPEGYPAAARKITVDLWDSEPGVLCCLLRPHVTSTPIPNLGPRSREWLSDLGIHSLQDLQHVGVVPAFLAAKERYAGVSLNLLWALAAAVEGRDWRSLTLAEKQTLLTTVNNHGQQ